MAKYVINEKSDLNSLAKQVEEIAQRQETAPLEEAVAAHEIVPEETAFTPARAKQAARQRPLLMGLVTAVAVVIVAGIVFMGFKTLFAPRQRAIPDLVNARLDKALTTLDSNGFRAKIEYDSASKKPSGTVVAQVPAASTKGRYGSSVTLRVAGKPASSSPQVAQRNSGMISLSQGARNTDPDKPSPTQENNQQNVKTQQNQAPPAPGKLTVPAVEGLKADEARKNLQVLGLKVLEIAGNDAAKPDGVVLAIEPKIGSEIEAGSQVRIRVNARPKDSTPEEVERPTAQEPTLVIVQDYTGIAGKDAVIDIEHRGLKAEWSYEESNQFTAGTVILTSPPAGSRVAPGTKVTLVLSR